MGGIEGLAEGLADPNRSWTSVTDSAIVGSSANVVGSALGNAIGRGFTGPWRNAVSNGMGNFLGNVLPQLLVTHTWNGRSAFFAGIAGVDDGAIGGPVGVVLADFLVWGVQYLIDPPHLKQQNLVPNDVSGTASGMWTSYSTQQSSGNTRGSDAW